MATTRMRVTTLASLERLAKTAEYVGVEAPAKNQTFGSHQIWITHSEISEGMSILKCVGLYVMLICYGHKMEESYLIQTV